jgi:hypothetical protein
LKWNSFTLTNKVYDLSHLDPFNWIYIVNRGKAEGFEEYKFHVTFSMHCFTRRSTNQEKPPEDGWYFGPIEKRLFCSSRYIYSFELPEIVKKLGESQCWHTQHGNFFTIKKLDSDGSPTEYEVYFDVTRSIRKGWLNLIIQSAYVRTSDYKNKQPRKRKIRLRVIAYNKQAGKDTKPGH